MSTEAKVFFGSIAIFLAITAIIYGFIFFTIIAIPIAMLVGIIKFIKWYVNRPTSLHSLYQTAQQQVDYAQIPAFDEFFRGFMRSFMAARRDNLPTVDICAEFDNIGSELYEAEHFKDVPPPPPKEADAVRQAQYRDQLIEFMARIQSPTTLDVFRSALIESFGNFHAALPPIAKVDIEFYTETDCDGTSAELCLIDVLPNVGFLVQEVVRPFFDQKTLDLGLFEQLRKRIDSNFKVASLMKHSPEAVSRGAETLPADYDGTPREIINLYLSGTPFEPLFLAPIPFRLPDETRFAGHWVIAPPGRGKTTLLHSMVMEDLEKDASVILMDSKGDLIEPFRDLKQIADRLIIIDPDPKNPIAFNPLDIPDADTTHAIDFLEYLFGSLLEFKMTASQVTLFRSVFRALVTAIPNPNLEILRDILANGYKKYIDYIRKLPPDLQDFFFNEFDEKQYTDRRKEVLQRIRLLLDNDTMKAMLLASHTRFRIGEAMDAGKVVIINTSKAKLGDQGSEFFGRFFIAQLLAASQQRSGRRAQDKKPCYFYIDECQTVIARDEKIPTILDECRSQKIALILAHQRTTQITSPNVLDALSNCAIRYTNSDDEAKYLAPKLRATPELIQSLKRGQFAAFVRDMTSRAIVFNVSKVDFAKHPTLNETEIASLKASMQARYGVQKPASVVEPAPTPQPAPVADPPQVQPTPPKSSSTPDEPKPKKRLW